MGSSSITGDETILFADNMSFDGTPRAGKMTNNGELWIGSNSSPHVKKGILASPDNSVTIGYNSPNINLTIPSGLVSYVSDEIDATLVQTSNFFTCINRSFITVSFGLYNSDVKNYNGGPTVYIGFTDPTYLDYQISNIPTVDKTYYTTALGVQTNALTPIPPNSPVKVNVTMAGDNSGDPYLIKIYICGFYFDA